MKKLLSTLIRGQRGQALPLALAMLAIGSLVVVPLLNLTETTLRAGISEERRMYEHYAANAGIMDGVWKIITDEPNIPPYGQGWSYSYSIPDTNGREVNVDISTVAQNEWKIASTATTGSGGSTELECYVEKKDYLTNAVTSRSVVVGRDAVVNGNVQWDSESGSLTNRGTINGEIIDEAISWPAIEEVDAFYLLQVEGAPVHEGDLTLTLGPETVGNPYSLGPIRINGNLRIMTGPAAIRFDGTVYVSGLVEINPNVDVYMNNNTIFCNGAFWISSSSPVYGYGCIVSRPSITFEPTYDPDACVILWSVEDVINVGSTGVEIYGAAYAPIDVTVLRDSVLTYVEHPPELSIPPLPGSTFRIVGWESTSQ